MAVGRCEVWRCCKRREWAGFASCGGLMARPAVQKHAHSEGMAEFSTCTATHNWQKAIHCRDALVPPCALGDAVEAPQCSKHAQQPRARHTAHCSGHRATHVRLACGDV
jgi:hypothetical protein